MAFTGKRKQGNQEHRRDDGAPNLEFFTGLYEGTGKVLFRAVLDSDRAKEALKNAIKATCVEGKISIVILEASKGDADAWAAFSGMPEPDDAPRKAKISKKVVTPKARQHTIDEEETDVVGEPVEAPDEEDWD